MEKKECSVWKVLLIIGAIVSGVIAVVAVALKLYSKYCLIDEPLVDLDEEDEEDLTDLEALDEADDGDEEETDAAKAE